jgi:hypothetical protein
LPNAHHIMTEAALFGSCMKLKHSSKKNTTSGGQPI